jgi:lysophospholipase L1-like esterase
MNDNRWVAAMRFHLPKLAFLLAGLVLCLPFSGMAANISGLIYYDQNENAVTIHQQPFWWRDAGIADVPLQLIGPTGISRTRTGADGLFTFAGLPAGSYLLNPKINEDPEPPVCTSHNRARRLPRAIAEGRINLVVFGDSNGVYGSDYPYPYWLSQQLGEFADVSLTNLSISGSTTWEWLPGAYNFDEILEPRLADADLVVFTLGGNDFLTYFGFPPYDPQELWQKILNLPAVIAEMENSLLTIADTVHAINPDADIVYIMYPVFANSAYWQNMLGDMWWLMRIGNEIIFTQWRKFISQAPYLIIADIMGSFEIGQMITEYLFDEIHPNDLGHMYYADQVFLSLSGVRIGEDELGLDRMIAFDSPDLGQMPRASQR